jgi:hypothetical protein
MQCQKKFNVLPYFKRTAHEFWCLDGCPEGTPTNKNATNRYLQSLQTIKSCPLCSPAVVAKAKALLFSYKVCI